MTLVSIIVASIFISGLNAVSVLAQESTTKTAELTKKVASKTDYEYVVDLDAIADDKLQVTLTTPKIESETVTFFIPKIVPGIYGAENYGRFIKDFEAFDADGRSLVTKKSDVNSWVIQTANKLHRLSYKVDDSWEELEHKPGIVKYRSAGSSFDAGERFVINQNCLFGYFENLKQIPIQVKFHHPKEMTGSSSLNRILENRSFDVFLASSYQELVDNPIVYGTVDKVTFPIANAEITIAVYSEDGKRHAEHFGKILKPLMQAQARYLGGQLPVERYTFILVWEEGPENSMLGDGLEHSHSTLVLLEGSSLEEATNFIRSICAHEFFHILMPLTIKSEQIANYDYNDPKQSRHLWLYEGMTEYATIHMPMMEGLIDRHTFLKSIQTKIEQSQNFRKDVSLTDISTNAMDMQDQYYNFYLKGTLACLCLDIELRELTDGKVGTQSLLKLLSDKYGEAGHFKDDELFDVIAKLTNPKIRDWFSNYVEGTKPLPLVTTLAKVGIDYDEENHQLAWAKSQTKQQTELQSHWLSSNAEKANAVDSK